MRISCNTRWCIDIPADLALAAIWAAGFEFVDIVSADDPSAAAMLDAIGPGMPQPGGLYWFDASSPGRIREGIHEAKARGVKVLTLGAWPRRQEDMRYFAQTLELTLADMPDDVSIELVNRSGTRLEQLGDFRELFVFVGHPRLSVAVDAVEFHRASVNPTGAILELGDRMTRLVVGDMIGSRRVPLGEGEINIPAVIERARRIGYNGWIAVAPCVSNPNAPHEDLVREHEWLRRMLEK
jgi:sugar phosphate isomerase/epimerase